jgi:sugar phosphate isomerase/epimerase
MPDSEERNKVMDLIITGLKELGNYAKKGNVTVLLETHGTVVKINDLKKIMQATENDNSGLIWDVVNMWSVTKEPPQQVYEELKKYIRHVHLKDIKFAGDKFNYVLFADGEAPVFEGINALHKGGYKSYYCFEWEKLWHPEIEEPEIALADFPRKMRKHFNSL